jgi:hypothetical protein
MKTANSIQRAARAERSPFALDPDFKAEMGYLVLGVAALIGLMVTRQLMWAVAFLMASLVLFGIWRIGRGKFE